MALKTTLTALEKAIKKSYPRKLVDFGKPAPKKSLDVLQKGVGYDLPADVITLYAWHGSAQGLLVDEDTDDSSDGWHLHDPAGVLADHRVWSKLSPKGWQPTWLPLFTNHAGDNVCLDAKSGELVGLFHEEPDGHPVIAKSLDDAFAFVFERVKAGTWRGVPESNAGARILAKLKKSPLSAHTVFGNDVYRLLSVDPRAVLQLLVDVEPLGISPSMLRQYEALANLRLEDADATYQSYLRYLAAIRKEGSTYNPPFRMLGFGFDEMGKKAWAEEMAELEALDGAYLLDPWLRATSRTSEPERSEVLKEVVASIDAGLAGSNGPKLARAYAVKAAALRELGDAAASTNAWALAAEADAKTAALWKGYAVLA